eukprot:TRINITY_DN902_c0_g3_i3.p1 TRINITY_DN902_c0_g3~~TRINITY_DN902_c0_g3_i3.p1  ORF type:complete len:162 (+),score=23.07 TRINITY_DN902_c0_g3_i3:36-521(+)
MGNQFVVFFMNPASYLFLGLPSVNQAEDHATNENQSNDECLLKLGPTEKEERSETIGFDCYHSFSPNKKGSETIHEDSDSSALLSGRSKIAGYDKQEDNIQNSSIIQKNLTKRKRKVETSNSENRPNNRTRKLYAKFRQKCFKYHECAVDKKKANKFKDNM